LEYSPHDPSAESINPTIFADEEVLAHFLKYTISNEDSFVPERLEIRESKSKGRRPNDDTRRIVFLGKDRLHYKVFKYPAQQLHKISDGDEDISMS
jgi:hypothetical protein